MIKELKTVNQYQNKRVVPKRSKTKVITKTKGKNKKNPSKLPQYGTDPDQQPRHLSQKKRWQHETKAEKLRAFQVTFEHKKKKGTVIRENGRTWDLNAWWWFGLWERERRRRRNKVWGVQGCRAGNKEREKKILVGKKSVNYCCACEWVSGLLLSLTFFFLSL